MLRIEIDTLQDEIEQLKGKKNDREEKIVGLQEEIKRLRFVLSKLEEEGGNQRQEMEKMQQQHAIELKKILTNQYNSILFGDSSSSLSGNGNNSNKTLQTTIELLQEQIVKLKEEKNGLETKTKQVDEILAREKQLSTKLEGELISKSEMNHKINVLEVENQNHLKMMEFLKKQNDDLRRTMGEETNHW